MSGDEAPVLVPCVGCRRAKVPDPSHDLNYGWVCDECAERAEAWLDREGDE